MDNPRVLHFSSLQLLGSAPSKLLLIYGRRRRVGPVHSIDLYMTFLDGALSGLYELARSLLGSGSNWWLRVQTAQAVPACYDSWPQHRLVSILPRGGFRRLELLHMATFVDATISDPSGLAFKTSGGFRNLPLQSQKLDDSVTRSPRVAFFYSVLLSLFPIGDQPSGFQI